MRFLPYLWHFSAVLRSPPTVTKMHHDRERTAIGSGNIIRQQRCRHATISSGDTLPRASASQKQRLHTNKRPNLKKNIYLIYLYIVHKYRTNIVQIVHNYAGIRFSYIGISFSYLFFHFLALTLHQRRHLSLRKVLTN